MNIDNFGAILHSKWLINNVDSQTITGKWAEDYSEYHIKVPPQLRDEIVVLQNALSDKYQQLEKMRHMLAKQESVLSILFNNMEEKVSE